jgi:putative DNA primase/helicase
MFWDDARWASDETGEVERRAKETILTLLDDARCIENDKERHTLLEWQRKSETYRQLQAMVRLAQSEQGIPVLPCELDVDPWLLNVANGTVDLRTGMLRSHAREDLITKWTAVPFEKFAKAPRWEAFVKRIFREREDLIHFVQKAVGYTLTGFTTEQVLLLLIGLGANGKSTLLEVLRSLMGYYAAQADFSSFVLQRQDHIRNDIARLVGARFVSAIEVDHGRRLAESLVKQLTGGDRVTARFLYREPFEFTPQFKLWLAANHKPRIQGTDHAIWRRIRLIPFDVQIPSEEQDRQLGIKLRQELPGILQWAVRGCLAWQEEGLEQPKAVQVATQEYREEMDILGGFLADCCDHLATMEGKEPFSDLYVAYRQWAEQTGERILSQRVFGTILGERGLNKRRSGSGGRVEYHGVQLNTAGRALLNGQGSVDACFRKLSHTRAREGDFSEKASESFSPSVAGPDHEDEERAAIREEGAA